jgi:hypothetical protein
MASADVSHHNQKCFACKDTLLSHLLQITKSNIPGNIKTFRYLMHHINLQQFSLEGTVLLRLFLGVKWEMMRDVNNFYLIYRSVIAL